MIVHVIRDGKILLHYKKRGHGAGKWNGCGGKIERGETPEECAIREAFEEMRAKICHLRKFGELEFYDVSGEDWFVYVFGADLRDEPVESEESRPEWFSLGEIPYGEMWEDDKYWLPIVVNGLHFRGKFWFTGDIMCRFKMEAWKE